MKAKRRAVSGGVKIHKKDVKMRRVNPFELKFNRNKRKVFAKGSSKVAVGAPTLSKKNAFENRLNSLAIELKQFNKTNKVVDRRLGEHDLHMTEEDRLVKRFTAERLKAFRTSKFQLADPQDEEELTHKGSALTSIEKYERTVSDDEDEEGGEMGADVVAVTHFGGGVSEDVDEKTAQKYAKRKDVIAELIAKTKQQRHDKQMLRDEQEDATERLDEQWNKLMHRGAMSCFDNWCSKKDKNNQITNDEYDLLLCELKMDNSKRGEATERQKTEEEIAREEKLKLIELERVRIARMEDHSSENKLTSKGGDVEDVCSGKRKDKKQSGFELKYDAEGKMIHPEKVKRAHIKLVKIDNESSDSEEDESITDDIGSEDEDFDSMLEQQDALSSDGEAAGRKPQSDSVLSSTEGIEGWSNLPYVFEMPSSYEDLAKLLQRYSASEISIIIDRIIKYHHPSLKEGNKKRLARIFLYLLRFYDSLSRNGATRIDTLGVLIKCLYSLLKFDIEYGARCLCALLRQQWKAHLRDRHTVFGFRVVSLVRLVAALFPVSDFFHPLCTPTLAYAVNVVCNVRVTRIRTAARILILISVITEYISETKRYIPELIAFMQGLVLMGIENKDEERSPTATFPISLPFRRMLFIENDCCEYKAPLMLQLCDVFNDDELSFDDTDANRLSVLRFAFALLCKLVPLYSVHHYSFKAIFTPLGDLLKRLPSQRYPPSLRAELEELQACIISECEKNSSLRQLQKPKQHKKMIEMLEPRFEENFNVERSRKDAVKGGKKAENKKLMRKYKKEMRGAMRELRKDNQFIAREKRYETEANDRMRREKTKQLMRSLQGQESEYKKNLYMKQAPKR